MKQILIYLFSSVFLMGIEKSAHSKTFIYYIPFEVETYMAVTTNNIKEKADYKFEINDKNTESALLDLTAGGKRTSSFDENRVRLLITYEDGRRQIFVDAIGNIFDGKVKRTISAQNFDKLKSLLSEQTKEMPIKNYKENPPRQL